MKLVYDGNSFDGICLANEPIPLHFDFSDMEGRSYHLKVKGLHQMIILNSYKTVLAEGKLFQLKSEDSKRLSDLKQMLDATGTNQIPIHREQLHFFLDKVVPSLRKIGVVTISKAISEQFIKTPLVAKLYLDRVRNRLLAGLEFQYENTVINPLEGREPRAGSILIRDVEKEDDILKLMEDSSFAKTDSGYFLQNEELEYEFLYHVVPKLQELVQIYATTAVRNRISRGNTAPSGESEDQKGTDRLARIQV